LAQLKQDISKKARERTAKIRKSRHLVPIFSAVFVVAMFLFLQYNRLIFASVEAYVSPGNSSAQNTIQAPNSSTAAEGEKLIIPKINVDVPINYGFGNDHASQMKAMETGVSHFAISGANSVPGQAGNVVLSGHSSNDLFDNGEYKFIFAQLEKMTEGDTIYVNHEVELSTLDDCLFEAGLGETCSAKTKSRF
jgi:sortase A